MCKRLGWLYHAFRILPLSCGLEVSLCYETASLHHQTNHFADNKKRDTHRTATRIWSGPFTDTYLYMNMSTQKDLSSKASMPVPVRSNRGVRLSGIWSFQLDDMYRMKYWVPLSVQWDGRMFQQERIPPIDRMLARRGREGDTVGRGHFHNSSFPLCYVMFQCHEGLPVWSFVHVHVFHEDAYAYVKAPFPEASLPCSLYRKASE